MIALELIHMYVSYLSFFKLYNLPDCHIWHCHYRYDNNLLLLFIKLKTKKEM